MIIHNPILTGSFTVNGTDVASITSSAASLTSLNAATASLNSFSASVLTFTASAATTGSNTFVGNQVVSGSLTVTGSITTPGTLTAQTLVVQTITSSVDFVTGSTRFGSLSSNTHVFTGSIFVSGSASFSSSLSAALANGPSLTLRSNSTSSYTYIGIGRIANDMALGVAGSSGQFFVGSISGDAWVGATNGTIGFGNDTSGTATMVIKSGNLGIGTTNPSYKLVVNSGTDGISAGIAGSTYGIRFDNGGTFSSGMSTIHGVDSTLIGSYQSIMINGLDVRFGTSATERMRITSGGALSFNSSPTTYGNFNIKSNNTTAYMGLNIYANGNSNFIYVNHNNNVGIIGTEFGTGGTGHTPLTFQAGGTERMRIATNGDVTFGVTSAYDTALIWRQDFTGGIHGRIYATGLPRVVVVAGESGGVQLTSGATSWTSNSDERLKNINGGIENALNKLLTLRAVNFSWKSDTTNKENLGLIAQDVEEQFPQIVDKTELPKTGEEEQTDKTEYLGVRYTELVPVLVKAIQELKAEIDELKNK